MSDAERIPGARTEPIADDELPGLFDHLARHATLIVAVSGGADSTALMHLLVRWAEFRTRGTLAQSRHGKQSRHGSHPAEFSPSPKIIAATVDHGLRPEAAGEAAAVGAQAAMLGIAHHMLRWLDQKPATAIQATARAARYQLLETLAADFPGAALVTAHHRDDQAETVLMRLARGSGVDGLAGISPSRPAGSMAHAGFPVARERPLLGLAKARLVATLEARHITWCKDPSNDDPAFERVRWRQGVPSLVALGLTSEAVARAALRLERARQALESLTGAAWSRLADVHQGAYASLDDGQFAAEPEEIRLRLLSRALTAFGGTGQAPSLSQAEELLAGVDAGAFQRRTLAGCLIERSPGEIRVLREPGRLGLPEGPIAPGETMIWDNRFEVRLADMPTGPACGGLALGGLALGGLAAGVAEPHAGGGIVRGLGAEGLAVLRERHDALPLSARVAVTLPSYWSRGRLVAVPHLGPQLEALRPGPTVPRFTARFLW